MVLFVLPFLSSSNYHDTGKHYTIKNWQNAQANHLAQPAAIAVVVDGAKQAAPAAYARKQKPVPAPMATQVQIQIAPQRLLNHIRVNAKQLQKKVIVAAGLQDQVGIAGSMEGNK